MKKTLPNGERLTPEQLIAALEAGEPTGLPECELYKFGFDVGYEAGCDAVPETIDDVQDRLRKLLVAVDALIAKAEQ